MITDIFFSSSQPYSGNSRALITTRRRSASTNDRNYITRVTTTYKSWNEDTGAFLVTKPLPPPDRCSSGHKKTIYKNSCGDITRIIYTDSRGITIKIANYDSCGKVSNTTYMDSKGDPIKIVYVDSDGNLIRTAYFDSNGETYKISYYDSKGNKSKTTYFDSKGHATKTIYFDSRGNTTKTVRYDSCGNEIKPDSSSSGSSSSCGCSNGDSCEKCKWRKIVYKDGRGNVWKITYIDCYDKTQKTDYPDSSCQPR